MFLASAPPLEQGERRILTLRPHSWQVLRPALLLALLLLTPILYGLLDLLLPDLRLNAYFTYVAAAIALTFVLLTLRWLVLDLLPWTQQLAILTNRRVIVQSGVFSIYRQECSLAKVEESDYTSSGLIARLLDIGDLEVETSGRNGTIVIRGVHRPRRVQGIISGQARSFREDETRRRVAEQPRAVQRQLLAIVEGTPPPALAPTESMRALSQRAIRTQQRLNLLPDEAVVESSRQHIIVLIVGLLGPLLGVFLVMAVVALIGAVAVPFGILIVVAVLSPWAAARILDYLAHEYVLTTERLMELRAVPFLYQTRNVVQTEAIQDITLEIPTIFSRIADIGDIVCDLPGPDEHVTIKTVAQPAEWQKLIFETIDAGKRKKREREEQRTAATLGQWFGEYHRLQQAHDDGTLQEGDDDNISSDDADDRAPGGDESQNDDSTDDGRDGAAAAGRARGRGNPRRLTRSPRRDRSS